VAKQKTPDATVIGIAGSGHLAGGHGIPHQLKDLGVAERVTLLPETTKSACQVVGASYADAIFTLPAAAAAPAEDRPRLGVMLADGGGRVQIRKVLPNSVAEAAGLRDGDQIVRAAGLDMRSSDDLIDVVGRQSFGTWLPLGIGRDGQEIEVVAKFPPRPRPAP
jgi:S1-C subfamily serine protease